jgi:hypothetical protein
MHRAAPCPRSPQWHRRLLDAGAPPPERAPALGLLAIRFPSQAAAGRIGTATGGRGGTGIAPSKAAAEEPGGAAERPPSPASDGSGTGTGAGACADGGRGVTFELCFAHTTPSMGLAYFSPRTMRSPRAWVARKPGTAPACNVGGIFIS